MVRDIRITYRRRCSYRTKSNRIVPVKTPGNRLVAHVLNKTVSGPKCGATGKRLGGLKATKRSERAKLSKFQRTVSRAYGGNLSAEAVKEKITRAFLIEENRAAKKLMAEKLRAKKAKQKN
eukprot:snap_masked-scaffold_6-processed-gene-19.20-mRNA-1 protein AED:0.38 eAED:0.38 QI:0/-1/0/1/-1/1/1/0/120